ncbi:MAG TPA: hypothetical protein VK829_19110 [Terriglobales bacterium]|jgi:hypothetical protein|nr:hypothetical protein [Terriglobales bacterium]
MRPLKGLLLWFVVATCLQAQKAEQGTPADQTAQTFRLDPHRPLVYLKFDHIGQGTRMNDQEPSARIWLHLINNCRLPIVVDAGGQVEGGLKGEIYVDNVVRLNPPSNGVSVLDSQVEPDSPVIPTTLTDPGQPPNRKNPTNVKPQAKPTADDEPRMPAGYPSSDVVSTETILPGAGVLFSVPIDFVTKKWHFEITFHLGPEASDGRIPEGSAFVNRDVRGQVEMILSYNFWDLPEEHQAEVEKLNLNLAKKP